MFRSLAYEVNNVRNARFVLASPGAYARRRYLPEYISKIGERDVTRN
jgi:hypothetical protein